MNRFSFKTLKGIYLVQLPNYRYVWREGNYGRKEYKKVNSYLLYNATNKTTKIINYDDARASIFNSELNAFVIGEHEKFLVAENRKCYYMDSDGNISPYDGDIISMWRTEITVIPQKEVEKSHSAIPINWDEFESGVTNEAFKFGGNMLTLSDGTTKEIPYIIKQKLGNFLLCYKLIPSNEGHWEEELYGICNNHGEIITEPKYNKVYLGGIKNGSFFEVRVNNKSGLINKDGIEIIPPIFDGISDCDGQVAIVDDEAKLINVNDLKVLYETTDRLEYVVNGWIRVTTRSYPRKPTGMLSCEGTFYPLKIQQPYEYGNLYDAVSESFYDGLLAVYSESRGYGYVNKDSKEVIKCKYCEIHDFHNGRAKVRYDCDYGYIDTLGNIFVKKDGEEVLISNKYDWAYDFDSEIAIVQKGKKYGCIDKKMNEVLPCVFYSSEDVVKAYKKVQIKSSSEDYENAMMELETPILYEDNKMYGYKNKNGIILCPPIFTEAHKFVEGLALVQLGGKVGYLNENLEFEIKPEYIIGEDFSEGLALVDRRKYINKRGECIIKPDFHIEKLQSFCDGKVGCEYNWCQPGRDNDDYILTKRIKGFK